MVTRPRRAFADVLRHSRQQAGLTQEQLAERAGVSTRAISNLERGVNRAPRRDTLDMLADALNLSPEERGEWERSRKRLAARPVVDAGGTDDGAAPTFQLPVLLTSFLGRERERDELAALLSEPGTRLLTLTGPGGVGKTRLGITVTEHMRPAFPDGACFVPLAPLSHHDLVVTAIVQALGMREADTQSPFETLRDFLRGRSLLLVLDNVEHVVDGTPVVGSLLEECAGLRVLATSRVPLRLRGEREYPVRPLPGEIAEQLFVERSRQINPAFDPDDNQQVAIAAICRRLDGLPLAIELAAARVKVLPPRALLNRLEHPLALLTGGPRDLPTRQQTLRATIGWSYELLGADEQALLQLLSVFTGGWSLEAVETLEGSSSLDALAALVDMSLVERHEDANGQPRFWMLETIREFGLEQLSANGTGSSVRERHARYFAELVLSAPPFLRGPDSPYWLDLFDAEHANIRVALEWFIENDVVTGLRMIASLWRFWWMRSHFAVGRRYCELMLAKADDAIDPAVLVPALTGAGVIIEYEDHQALDRAAALQKRALGIWLDLHDPPEGAYWSYLCLGGIVLRKNELGEARAYFQEAFEYSTRHGQTYGKIGGLLLLAYLMWIEGQTGSAMRGFQESLNLAREYDDLWTIAMNTSNIGALLLYEGHYDEARPLILEALELNRKLKHTRDIAGCLGNLADLEFHLDRFAEAEALYRESLADALRSSDWRTVGFAWLGLARVALESGDSARAQELCLQGLISMQSVGEPDGVVSAIEALATVHQRSGDLRQAARMYAWASTFRAEMGVPPWTIRRAEIERGVAALRSALAPDEFDAAWAEGTELTLDQVCDECLAEDHSASDIG